MTALREVVATSGEVAGTTSRRAKIARIADLLRAADPSDMAVVVAWLAGGGLPQRQIGVGWAGLRSLPAPAATSTLTVAGVDERLSAIGSLSGTGSQVRRAEQVAALFAAATGDEQVFLRRLVGGELRQGALAGVVAEAVAQAAELSGDAVRRAAMLAGSLPAVAAAALRGEGLGGFALQVGRPVGPMLAQTAMSVADALSRTAGTAIVETKLDGARIQVHRDGDDVRVFTRSLDDVTAHLPEVVSFARGLPAARFVADGEAIALRPDGRPEPFQVTASRYGSRAGNSSPPLHTYLFDLLYLDAADLLDRPTVERLAALDALVPPGNRVHCLVTDDPDAAQDFFTATLAGGHEGVMVKAPGAPYEAGRRGAAWLKVKPVHTLDLVVLAVERGSGRRTGTLSNIHLGARDSASGAFVMLGKTFKGMTDAMLAWQTQRFRELADGPTDGYVVRVRPEQVVEVAFDGVQVSRRYPGGVALRFARVVRYREDKHAAEADTIETVRAYLPG